MNCRCNPSRPAVIRRVSKSGPNNDKEFFACEKSSEGCNFFQWADATMPPPPSRIFSSKGKPSLPAGKTSERGSKVRIKIALSSIQANDQSPMKIFLYLQSPSTPEISRFLESLPKDLCYINPSTKLWIFSLELYERVIAFFETEEIRKLQLQIDTLPRFLVVGLKNYLKRINILPDTSTMELNITPSLKQILLPFQVEGIRFVVARGGRGLIGDEMGCGKTVQAIAILQHFRRQWPALLIVPPNLMDQWKGEILKFSADFLTEQDLCFVKKASDKVVGRIVIIPYSIIEKVVEQGKIRPEVYGVVIADESHKLKSPDAQRTKTVLPFLKRAQVAICLTGTPAVNRPVELFTQLSALLPNVFTDYKEFIIRYCDAKPAKFKPNILEARGASNEVELKLLLESMVMIRRYKADVVSLPTKTREVRYVEADGKYLAELLRLQKKSAELENDIRDVRKTDEERQIIKKAKESALMLLYQMTGLSKIKGIKVELLRQIDEARIERAKDWSRQVSEKILAADDEIIDITTLGAEDPEFGATRMDYVDLCEDNDASDDEGLVDTDDEIDGSINSGGQITKKMNAFDRLRHAKEENRKFMQRSLDDLFSKDIRIIESGSEGGNEEDNEEAEFDGGSSIVKMGARKSSKASKRDEKGSLSAESSSEQGSAGITKLSKKILVFAHHQRVLDAIENVLREASVGYVRVDGKTNSAKKSRLIQQFQVDPSIDVALLAITACGTGLNMTVANVAIFAELYWSPGDVLQAEDRIHRIGQSSEEVKIIYLLAKNTADDIVWEQIHRKQNMLEATIGNGGHESSIAANISANNSRRQSITQGSLDRFVLKKDAAVAASSSITQPPPSEKGFALETGKIETNFPTQQPTNLEKGSLYQVYPCHSPANMVSSGQMTTIPSEAARPMLSTSMQTVLPNTITDPQVLNDVSTIETKGNWSTVEAYNGSLNAEMFTDADFLMFANPISFSSEASEKCSTIAVSNDKADNLTLDNTCVLPQPPSATIPIISPVEPQNLSAIRPAVVIQPPPTLAAKKYSSTESDASKVTVSSLNDAETILDFDEDDRPKKKKRVIITAWENPTNIYDISLATTSTLSSNADESSVTVSTIAEDSSLPLKQLQLPLDKIESRVEPAIALNTMDVVPTTAEDNVSNKMDVVSTIAEDGSLPLKKQLQFLLDKIESRVESAIVPNTMDVVDTVLKVKRFEGPTILSPSTTKPDCRFEIPIASIEDFKESKFTSKDICPYPMSTNVHISQNKDSMHPHSMTISSNVVNQPSTNPVNGFIPTSFYQISSVPPPAAAASIHASVHIPPQAAPTQRQLTIEQLETIERNKQEALRKRKAALERENNALAPTLSSSGNFNYQASNESLSSHANNVSHPSRFGMVDLSKPGPIPRLPSSEVHQPSHHLQQKDLHASHSYSYPSSSYGQMPQKQHHHQQQQQQQQHPQYVAIQNNQIQQMGKFSTTPNASNFGNLHQNPNHPLAAYHNHPPSLPGSVPTQVPLSRIRVNPGIPQSVHQMRTGPPGINQQQSNVPSKIMPFYDSDFSDDLLLTQVQDSSHAQTTAIGHSSNPGIQFQTATQNTVTVNDPRALERARQIFSGK